MATIGFIGGGNMAASLIGGLINAGIPAADIIVAEPDEARSNALKEQFKVTVSSDNNATLKCQTVVLAVKPQLMKQVCQQLDSDDLNDTLVISIAAGVTSGDIDCWLNNNRAIVRCMPNTPALLQTGASGLFANARVSDTQKQQAEKILSAVGIVVWVENEAQLNAVTAVSGSGPAYFFLMMEAMQAAGEKLGLSSEVAQKLVLQTALGAARMASESSYPPAELRRQVTSKGGTTEQAILSFQRADFEQIVFQALEAANNRSISLAEELGSE
jgi:pyrroline-5-carboxylate reductase